MIKIQVNDEMFAYDMYHITKAFCPGVAIEQKVDRESTQAVTIIMTEDDKFIQSSTCVNEYDTQAFTQRTLQINESEFFDIKDRKIRKRYVNLLHKIIPAQTGQRFHGSALRFPIPLPEHQRPDVRHRLPFPQARL